VDLDNSDDDFDDDNESNCDIDYDNIDEFDIKGPIFTD
jgi:hypothetical protein